MIKKEFIENIWDNATIIVGKLGKKTTCVTAILRNGFEITQTSSCVNKDDYDEQIGKDLCIGKIKNKLWELEGYRQQVEMHRKVIQMKQENY